VIFFALLLISMVVALIVQHFIGPLPVIGSRVLLMPIIMFYGALALPAPGMLALAFCGGLMWDALHTNVVIASASDPAMAAEASVEIAMGWSIVLYAALGALMGGFRPLFQRGRWEIHCLLSGVCTALIVLAEYLMITFRREPVVFLFDKEIWWRIGGSGLVAILLSPFFFFALNYLAFLVGYDPQPERNIRRSR
jgi:hypothetical protein